MPIPGPRTVADIDRDLGQHTRLLHIAVSRWQMDVAELNAHRIDALLDERLTHTREASCPHTATP